MKVLVIDDEPDVQLLITQFFDSKIKSGEYEFIFACNGLEGVEKLESDHTIDIILTDLNMPKMSGFEFLEKLKEMNRLLSTVVISAYGDMKNIRAAMNLGVYDFIPKPIDFEIMERVLDKTYKHQKLIETNREFQEQLAAVNAELKIAKQIQDSIIPNDFNLFANKPHVKMSGFISPAGEVGGDSFDLIPIDDDNLEVIIADVAGKNIAGTLLMAIVKTFMSFFSLKEGKPIKVLEDTAQFMNKVNKSNIFITSFLGTIDLNTGDVQYSNAGHPPPLILHKDGSVEELRGEMGPALGMVREVSAQDQKIFKENQHKLQAGDVLLLYTDGATQALNQNFEGFGADRLKESLKQCLSQSAEEMIDNIFTDIKAHMSGHPQIDDITLLAIAFEKNEGG